MNWPWKRKTVILGSEVAAAQRQEEARIASGIVGESPLPANRYDQESADYDLVAVFPLKLDQDLRALTNAFVGSTPNRRSEIRQIIPSDDLYTLIHFVKRASVLALNHDALEWCRAAIVALSMIDETRVDWRDVKWSAGLLEHTLVTVPGITDCLMGEIESFSKSTVAFLSHLPKRSHLLDWGYSEIRHGDTIGLIQTSYSDYNPTVDLTGIALRISDQLTRGRYIAKVEIATELPEIWFGQDRRTEVRDKLTNCLAAASIHGNLRRDYSDSPNQLLVAWVIEMPAASDCRYLVEAVGDGAPLSGRYAAGVSEGKLFALVVAGSFQEGVEPFESPASLQELAEQTRLVLERDIV